MVWMHEKFVLAVIKTQLDSCQVFHWSLSWRTPHWNLDERDERKQSIENWVANISHYQCCVTRVGTRTRVHFTRTRTRVQFFSLWLGLRNRDSWLGSEEFQAVAAVPCCAVYSRLTFDTFCCLFSCVFLLGFLRTLTLTLRWWLGFDNLDSDIALLIINI